LFAAAPDWHAFSTTSGTRAAASTCATWDVGTRAKRLVVLAGSRRVLPAAVRTKGAGRRHTALVHRLHPA
jgi:hypothetical protein